MEIGFRIRFFLITRLQPAATYLHSNPPSVAAAPLRRWTRRSVLIRRRWNEKPPTPPPPSPSPHRSSKIMSIVCGRFAFPVLSSSPLRYSFTRLLYFTSGAAAADSAKLTARATTLSPGNNSHSPNPFSSNLSVSSLESFTPRQKDQISLYVRTLLQWNEVLQESY